jgi:hypothetical protein
MVKNLKGGKKSKNVARKNIVSNSSHRRVRLSDGPLELYAQVIKYLGNSMCHVFCSDLKTRLCFIRGKFKGRGKRDNRVEAFTWVLIGLREWASTSDKSSKLDSCDLLEVYSEMDKQSLHDKERTVNWKEFTTINTTTSTIDDEEEVQFNNNATEDEYKELTSNKAPDASKVPLPMFDDDDDDNISPDAFIDIDDI